MAQNQRPKGPRIPASWEKYVKKYVWDDDSTPYFIPVKRLKKYQADKELFLYCALLLFPAAMLVFAWVSALSRGDNSFIAFGLYGAALLVCLYFLKVRKSISAALFTISAPILLLLHFAINGFEVPNLDINKVEIASVDTEADTLSLAKTKRWKTGYKTIIEADGAKPAPLAESTLYVLIKKDYRLYQLAHTREDAARGLMIDLTSEGSGTLLLRRIIQLHFIEQAGMIIILLLWLRYTVRVVAITKAYPSLSSIKKDDNPWNKFNSNGPPPG